MVSILALPDTHSDKLLEFIRMIIPVDNDLPSSFGIIKKKFTKNSTKEFKLCHICKRELINKTCPSAFCITNSYTPKFNISKSIKVVTADIHTQIHTVIQSNLDTLNRYNSML